jgi:putative endonuclease
MYFVYLLASRRNGTLYLGVTKDLIRRTAEHKSGEIKGFSSRYGVKQSMWFEAYDNAPSAIKREKEIKKWRRVWKVALIEKENPEWRDLYGEISR